MKPLTPLVFLLLIAPLAAQESEQWTPRTPAELAAESDYVVLAQLDVYKYEERREVPVSGNTWFDVLVPYKVPRPVQRFKVVEEGFGDRKCYFDEAELWSETPRYLLFLVDNPDGKAGEVRGHPDGCAVSVLTTTDNQYVVRWPIDHLRFDADVESLVGEYEFHGPGATVDLSDYLGFRRDEEIERLFLEPVEDDRRRPFIYRYTRGIPLSEFRRLLGNENLTRDRIQRGG